MLFTTYSFAALLAVTVALYWLLPGQVFRLALLLAASTVFYGWGHHWTSLALLAATVVVNWAAGILLERRRSRLLLAAALAVDLGTLAWFKYARFLGENLRALLALAGVRLELHGLPDYLPLGISFFTFQVVAYQIDVWRRDVPAEPSLLTFAVFKSFFAQLVAGPIVRAREFLPQLRERRRFDPEGFHHGLFLLAAGLALKVGVADVLAQFVREGFAAPARLATTAAWTDLYAFAFQIYADFWGYSTMAVGMGLLLGLELPANFDSPYRSRSLREFWRRWHITLSFWFRDYVYIPLGGNLRRERRNLLLTFAAAGLWHGAGWTFVLWGIANGLWLVVERELPRLGGEGRAWNALRTLLVFHGVCLAWVLFRAPSLPVALAYYGRLLLPPYTGAEIPGILSTWLLAFAALQFPLAWLMRERRFVRLRLPAQVATAAALLYLSLAYAGAQVDFIYFNF
ncbi:MAG: MBOAT family O-acyltransferase [Myxococcales bacterium]